MAGANLLSDEALRQVREVVRQTQGEARGTRAANVPPIAPGPECFIAKSPSGGIAARSGTTVSGEECDLYRTAEAVGTTDRTLSAMYLSDGMTPNTRTVYNFSSEAVSANAWIIISRDKLGTWWVIAEEC